MITDTLSYSEALFVGMPLIGIVISLFLLITAIGDYCYRKRRGQNGPIALQCVEDAVIEAMRLCTMILLAWIAWPALNQYGDQANLHNPVVIALYVIDWLVPTGSVATYLFRRRSLAMLDDLATKRARIKRIGGKW